MLSPKFSPLIIGIVSLGCLDAIGLITMIAIPDLTERIIPALVGIQIIGFAVIAFVYMSRNQLQLGSADSALDSEQPQKHRWTRVRWLWFALAVFGILQTPTAVINATHTVNSNHRLMPIMIGAFVIRFGMIWLCLKLWWQFRPANQ